MQGEAGAKADRRGWARRELQAPALCPELTQSFEDRKISKHVMPETVGLPTL